MSAVSGSPIDRHRLVRVALGELPARPLYALNFLCLPTIPDVGVTDQGIIETASMEIVETVVG